ncbi:MAG: histidine phosphatase family protein [Methylotenera sp.]
MANLILWRHADAEVESASGKDCDRALTKKGRKDAIKIAKWLNQHLPANTEIICSPARRCLETAAALHDLNGVKIKEAEFLSVDSSVERIAKEVINADSSKTMLIIGHQPTLGMLIAKLLGLNERTCVVKKGAAWWLRQRYVDDAEKTTLQTYLFAVQHPDL